MLAQGKKIYEAYMKVYSTLIKLIIEPFLSKIPWASWFRCIINFEMFDCHERYKKVAELLKRANCYLVLDIDSEGPSPLSRMGFQVISLDIKPKKGIDIVAIDRTYGQENHQKYYFIPITFCSFVELMVYEHPLQIRYINLHLFD